MNGLEVYYDRLDEIKQAVERYFTIEDVFYEAGTLTFLITDKEIKERFKRLYRDLKKLGFIPAARKQDGRIVIISLVIGEPAEIPTTKTLGIQQAPSHNIMLHVNSTDRLCLVIKRE